MSQIRGRVGEPWSLPEAVNALAEAARQAGRPSWLLLAGLLFPSVLLVFDFPIYPTASEAILSGSWNDGNYGGPMGGSDIEESVVLSISFLVVVFLPLMRLVVGLAVVTSPTSWNQFATRGKTPGLRDAFRAGKGLWLSGVGLYVQTFIMVGMGFLICLGPAALGLTMIGFDEDVMPVFLLPIFAFLLFYSLVLSVMYQLALQSLTQNRRGVGSAMQHAWRLMQAHPWAVGRTLLVDTVLSVTGTILTVLLTFGAVATCGLLAPIVVAVTGFVGVTRAGFWSRAYRSLGGVTQEDGLPGLKPVSH